jgi:hypothetical protein
LHNSGRFTGIHEDGKQIIAACHLDAGCAIPAPHNHLAVVATSERVTMKKVLGMVLLMLPLTVFAQSGIDGTWKIDLNKAQLDSKPRVLELKDGMYACLTCDSKTRIKADGQEHAVSGSPYYDKEKVSVMDPHKVEVVGTKDGKLAFRATLSVSDDGKTLTRDFEQHMPGSSQPANTTSMFSRVGEPETGAGAISGSWKLEKFESASPNWLTFTFASTGDGLNYKASTGEMYHAKFDGKDYPYQNDPGTTSVVLKKVDANPVEETDKRDGKVIAVSRLSVSEDGKSLTMVTEDKLRGITDTFVAEKENSQEAEK